MSKVAIQLQGDWKTKKVLLNSKPLSPKISQKIRNHSPDGFNWGYGGSGPAQLALAVLLELFPFDVAVKNYQDFKFKVIAALPQDNFDIDIDIEY